MGVIMSFEIRMLSRQTVSCMRVFYSTSRKAILADETAGELIRKTLEEIKRRPVDPKTRDAALKKLIEEAKLIDPNTVGASERLIDRVAVAIQSTTTKN